MRVVNLIFLFSCFSKLALCQSYSSEKTLLYSLVNTYEEEYSAVRSTGRENETNQGVKKSRRPDSYMLPQIERIIKSFELYGNLVNLNLLQEYDRDVNELTRLLSDLTGSTYEHVKAHDDIRHELSAQIQTASKYLKITVSKFGNYLEYQFHLYDLASSEGKLPVPVINSKSPISYGIFIDPVSNNTLDKLTLALKQVFREVNTPPTLKLKLNSEWISKGYAKGIFPIGSKVKIALEIKDDDSPEHTLGYSLINLLPDSFESLASIAQKDSFLEFKFLRPGTLRLKISPSDKVSIGTSIILELEGRPEPQLVGLNPENELRFSVGYKNARGRERTKSFYSVQSSRSGSGFQLLNWDDAELTIHGALVPYKEWRKGTYDMNNLDTIPRECFNMNSNGYFRLEPEASYLSSNGKGKYVFCSYVTHGKLKSNLISTIPEKRKVKVDIPLTSSIGFHKFDNNELGYANKDRISLSGIQFNMGLYLSNRISFEFGWMAFISNNTMGLHSFFTRDISWRLKMTCAKNYFDGRSWKASHGLFKLHNRVGTNSIGDNFGFQFVQRAFNSSSIPYNYGIGIFYSFHNFECQFTCALDNAIDKPQAGSKKLLCEAGLTLQFDWLFRKKNRYGRKRKYTPDPYVPEP